MGKKSDWLEEGEDVRDDGAEGPSAVGDGGQAAMSLMPDIDGSHMPIFESPQHEASYVGDLLWPP